VVVGGCGSPGPRCLDCGGTLAFLNPDIRGAVPAGVTHLMREMDLLALAKVNIEVLIDQAPVLSITVNLQQVGAGLSQFRITDCPRY